MKRAALALCALLSLPLSAQGAQDGKTFPPDERVVSEKVSFTNRYGIALAGELYLPKDLDRSKRHAALVVGHPFGGVKEQCAGLHAQELAARGFVTLTFDASYSGESGGEPRLTVSPEADVEDFSAAVDFLGTRPFVDRKRIGGVGICGSGAFLLSAAAIDPRIRAVATISMYDMCRFRRQGMNDSMDLEQRKRRLEELAQRRWEEFEGAEPKIQFGTPETLPEGAGEVAKEFFGYYRTERGRHPGYRGTRCTSDAALMNFFPLQQMELVSPRPILFVVGERAHSRYFSEDAYKLAAEPKELLVVPGANHVDLYDQKDKIPFARLERFFRENLN